MCVCVYEYILRITYIITEIIGFIFFYLSNKNNVQKRKEENQIKIKLIIQVLTVLYVRLLKNRQINKNIYVYIL